MNKFSIIIPVYNEEKIIQETIKNLNDFLLKNYKEEDYEIIAVNDGSTDKTKNILADLQTKNIRIINHIDNKGYGAALKTGAKNAQYNLIMFFDGDGQHKPEYIPELLKYGEEYDMVVGMRQGYQGPSWRQPGKKILTYLANYLVNKKIPDLNSGMRLIKKELFFDFLNILPDGFSLSTTITMAFFSNGLNIKYIPITINKRVGKSTVKVKDGFNAIMLSLRLIMLFNPLKIFTPISFVLFFGGLFFSIYGIMAYGRFPTSGAVIIIAGIILFFNGLLADQIKTIIKK